MNFNEFKKFGKIRELLRILNCRLRIFDLCI